MSTSSADSGSEMGSASERSSSSTLIDPFERSRLNTLRDIFDKEPEYQWQLDMLEKSGFRHPGKNPGFEKYTRVVNGMWPRDPKGKDIRVMPDGYSTPNSTRLWGSTLFDFFWVKRFPSIANFVGIWTGSMLSSWVKANGEVEYAKAEIAWAEKEEKPKLRPAADIMEIISARDLMIILGSCGISMRDDDGEEDSEDEQEDEATARPPVLPFDYKNYPRPWPLVPFSSKLPGLQSPIPLRLLPETLIVHDPFGLLYARSVNHKDSDWTSVEDITHRYHLNVTVDSVNETIAAERAKIAEAANSSEPVIVGVLFVCSDNSQLTKSSGTSGNAYRITVPPPPSPPSSTPEAHLFISPAARVGEGNHSFVYRAEWDLPRSVFSKPDICLKCVEAAALEILQTKAGKMAVRSVNPDVDSSHLANEGGKFLRRETLVPSLTMKLTKGYLGGPKVEPTAENTIGITVEDDTELSYVEYTGSLSTVHVDRVPWYDPASTAPCPCHHLMQNSLSGPIPGPTPPTARVSVVAKLSHRGDDHLDREAVNYQRFGENFSQHWTGYTLAYPLHNPTPVHAITPNFYGYYSKERTVPDVDANSGDSDDQYFSPILLLEDCGTPIEPTHLDFDDRQECAALLLRMHYHGWTQGSFFPRNILMQLGDHADFPLMKSPNDRRFRLIDFGRAKNREDAVEADRLRGDGKHSAWDGWDSERFDEKNEIWKVLNFPHPI